MKTKRILRPFFWLMIHHIFEFWYLYLIGIVFLVLTQEIQTKIPFMAKDLGDQLMNHSIHNISLWKFLLVAIGTFACRTISRLLFFYPARVQQKYLRTELVELIEESHPHRYEKFPAGQIYQMLFVDLGQIRALVGFAFLQIVNVIIAFIVIFPKILHFDKNLSIAFLPLVVCVLIFIVLVNFQQRIVKNAQDLQGDVQQYLIESYAAKFTIKNFHAENSFIDIFKSVSKKELDMFFKAGMSMSSILPMVRIGMGLSLIWGAKIIYEQNLGASSLILFTGFLFLILEPLYFLSWVGAVYIRARASWVRIKDLIDSLSVESKIEEKYLSKKDSSYVFDFWGKTLSFPIQNFKQGELVCLTGETGVGKSYLLFQLATSLILNHKSIVFVNQEPYLYNDSVLKNIFLGKVVEPNDKSKAVELLKLFRLEEIVGPNEDILELNVGENGKRLSGGQIKRLCLVRSLFSDSEIIIWDDPFSSIDLILEKEILTSLKAKNFFENKIVIYSTHRLSTVCFSQTLIWLDKVEGIKTIGNTKDLLNENRELNAYFKKQMA